jgi:hypothetical protein
MSGNRFTSTSVSGAAKSRLQTTTPQEALAKEQAYAAALQKKQPRGETSSGKNAKKSKSRTKVSENLRSLQTLQTKLTPPPPLSTATHNRKDVIWSIMQKPLQWSLQNSVHEKLPRVEFVTGFLFTYLVETLAIIQ